MRRGPPSGAYCTVTARDVSAVQDLADRFPTTQRLALDVTDQAWIASATRRTEERFGGIDVLSSTQVTPLSKKSGQSSRCPPVAEAIRSLSSLIAWFEIPKRLAGSTARLNSAPQESAVLENTRGRNRCRILPTPW